MSFALHLRESLDQRQSQVEREFAAGANLRTILTRYLTTVEDAADTELLTSILLLDASGKRLRHAAGPRLPQSYCEAIDGGEIGPAAGSCGTAAYVGHAIYVIDIETDPLWAHYRDVALEHGLRACWSTPIFDEDHGILGTFAIYHPTCRSPTREEVQAIAIITDRVAEAITLSRRQSPGPFAALRLPEELVAIRDRLDGNAASLRRLTTMSNRAEVMAGLKAVAEDCREVLSVLQGWSGRPN